MANDRPGYIEVGSTSPKDVLVADDGVFISGVLESGVGKIEPGDVIGKNSSGYYEQYDKVSGTVSEDDVHIYTEQFDIDSDETDDKRVNIPVTVAGTVKSGTLNHFGSNAYSDLDDDFTFV